MPLTQRAAIAALACSWLSLWQRPHPTTDRAIALHAADFIDHCPGSRPPHRAGFCSGIAELLAIFPDFHAKTTLLTMDDAQSLATIRWHATGTQRGTFSKCPPTNRLINFNGIEIIRCKNNLITERWAEWDEPALIEQMTNLASPGETI
jgi:predicted ester cyclase